ncbi:hypothetical protein MRB53_026801 [Persea americana]|uniref:Uncharacterized protein n=1 Tax=Persea americana TaxID=3435 RepID=A0ACC2LJ27_PERAE|nr:hypothetical protein MRB53_026801 [Persea americana]
MEDCCCRPLGFLVGLPFALLSIIFSILGAIIYILGSLLSCLCPCSSCFAVLADMALHLVTLPLSVIGWFIDQIPC